MSTRHIARTLALQTLFELDMKGELGISPNEVEGIIARNRDEAGEAVKDLSFAKEVVTNALSRRITIDDIITRAAPDWPLDKIGIVDRNILRLGLTELLFGDRTQVPPKVAIDEAIELAKAFGGETSGRFVNGVLGAIYKEMGEPEKGQTTKSKKEYFESGKRELLAGAVVCAHHNNKVQVALVHDVFGYWTLPKGHIGLEEKGEEGVVREIKKEIGLYITVLEKLGENQYIANKPDQGKVVKHVNYYLATSDYTDLQLEKKGGLDEAKWFSEIDAVNLRVYDDIKPLIRNAIDKVKNV
ncbi:MAG: NusB antitermination factor, utilization substance protein [Candidatus Nomurabacteria bacterium]|nr:NusB antitermination factor, utilization substance protein [Candidatus Nomurabacteria bacterium]